VRNQPALPCGLVGGIDRNTLPGSIRAIGAGRLQDIRKRRSTMGDKSKKDKDKGQKQNVAKQKQKTEKKIEKQPKRGS
jgi:hypothetical protein